MDDLSDRLMKAAKALYLELPAAVADDVAKLLGEADGAIQDLQGRLALLRRSSAACEGEQGYFEAWAKRERYDMGKHPLHYLFMDPKTNAARMGWKAALAYIHALATAKGSPAAPTADHAGTGGDAS